jgi:hypothetical protein
MALCGLLPRVRVSMLRRTSNGSGMIHPMKLQTKSGKRLHPIGVGTWNISSKFEADPTAKYKGTQPVYGNEAAEVELTDNKMGRLAAIARHTL